MNEKEIRIPYKKGKSKKTIISIEDDFSIKENDSVTEIKKKLRMVDENELLRMVREFNYLRNIDMPSIIQKIHSLNEKVYELKKEIERNKILYKFRVMVKNKWKYNLKPKIQSLLSKIGLIKEYEDY